MQNSKKIFGSRESKDSPVLHFPSTCPSSSWSSISQAMLQLHWMGFPGLRERKSNVFMGRRNVSIFALVFLSARRAERNFWPYQECNVQIASVTVQRIDLQKKNFHDNSKYASYLFDVCDYLENCLHRRLDFSLKRMWRVTSKEKLSQRFQWV